MRRGGWRLRLPLPTQPVRFRIPADENLEQDRKTTRSEKAEDLKYLVDLKSLW